MKVYRQLPILLLLSTCLPVALTGAAPPAVEATPASRIRIADGFRIDLLHSVPAADQGSWVAMTVDPQGRLITSDQYGKLYRVTLPRKNQAIKIEEIPIDLGRAHGLLCAFDSLYAMVNGEGMGLYRVTDSDGDDQYDTVKLLRAFKGGGEHGPHAIVLAPDGKSLYFCAGNHTDPIDFDESRVPRVWQEDHIIPRMWDARGHATGKMAPGGWICRTDPDGNKFELISNGYRNEYDIAFNDQGELFTYDADMEWDVGTPWYRPTRINHVTSGSEFGWRSGTGKWPEFYPDSLPSVVDVGPGSPTGIVFGTGAKFPQKYQRALFICDWSYGVLYAVHLEPSGSTYRGTLEHFASAAPLPLTDLVIHPDGNMYVTIGGRRTQSGLYRISYIGNQPTAPAKPKTHAGADLRNLRRKLESFHGNQNSQAIETAWPYLSHPDRFIRFAARIAIEHQPVHKWQEQALNEANPLARIEASLALARHGHRNLRKRLLTSLAAIRASDLNDNQQLALIRAVGLTIARMGSPESDLRKTLIEKFDTIYPSRSTPVNQELCRLLVALDSPTVVEKSLPLIKVAGTQEEQIHYLLCLRNVDTGWSLNEQKAYFSVFQALANEHGGASFGGFLKNIRQDALAKLAPANRAQLGDLALENLASEPATQVTRSVVKQWTVDDLVGAAQKSDQPRDYQRGKTIFAAASCYKCHRLNGSGGISGPDLTAVSGRFSVRDMLVSIIEPSKVISDQYELTRFVLDDGRDITGRIVNLNRDKLQVNPDMLDPNLMIQIQRHQVEEMTPSPVSPMPTGLLDTFTEDEILDLLAYLRSGGDPKSPLFANDK